MNKKLKQALSLACIAPITSFCSPLAFPELHMWHFTVGTDTGIEKYDAYYKCHDQLGVFEGSNYVLGLNQSVGYGKWFYMQAKESGSFGITSNEFDATTGHAHDRRSSAHFLDLDLRAYFPIALSQTYMVSLQPQIGFAAHWVHLRARGNTEATLNNHYTRYRTRSFAPLMGLALGCDVTECFNFRFGIAFEIQNQRSLAKASPTTDSTSWVHLRMRRASVHSTLDLNYKVGRNLDLTGTLDHLNYCPIGDENATPGAADFSYINRLTYKAGVRWNF